jgi:hypothetical protein
MSKNEKKDLARLVDQHYEPTTHQWNFSSIDQLSEKDKSTFNDQRTKKIVSSSFDADLLSMISSLSSTKLDLHIVETQFSHLFW